MGILKKLGSVIGKITGTSAAKQTSRQANEFANIAAAQKFENERKEKRERARANKLSIRGLRSKRAAAYLGAQTSDVGSSTIG